MGFKTSQPRWAGLLALCLLALSGCSSLPPGAHFPKTPSRMPLAPQDTRLGAHFQQNLLHRNRRLEQPGIPCAAPHHSLFAELDRGIGLAIEQFVQIRA